MNISPMVSKVFFSGSK